MMWAATLLFAALTAGACPAKKAPAPAPAEPEPASAASDAPADPDGPVWYTLPGLGLQLQAPRGATVQASEGGGASVTIATQSGPLVVRVRQPGPKDPADMASAAHAVRSSFDPFQRFSRREANGEDGWRLEFELKDAEDSSTTIHGLELRAKVAGRAISCERRGPAQDPDGLAVAACLSLRPAR